jgi:hypothetical protein
MRDAAGRRVRLCRHRDGIERGLSPLRRSQAGSNPHQCASVDEGRERREGRTGG